MSMPTASLENAKQNAQSKEDCKQDFTYLWTMYFRHGMNAALTKGFYHVGDLNSARKRAEYHCKVMGYKFIFIRPMICSLEDEENYKLKGSAEGELVP